MPNGGKTDILKVTSLRLSKNSRSPFFDKLTSLSHRWEGNALEEHYYHVSRSGGGRAAPEAPRGGRRASSRSAGPRGRAAPPPKRPNKRKRSPFSAFLWGCYKLVAVLSALIVAGFLGFKLLVQPPAQTAPTPDPASSAGDVSQDHDAPYASEDDTGTLKRRDQVYTFLLAATDKEGFRTDTMMVLSYDVPNQKIGVVSIPRDTITDRPQGKDPKLVYGAGGVTQRVTDISTMLGIPIDYYIKVNINGFIALVDYLDGVDFYVPCDMSYDDPYQDLSIHFKEGMQHLNGKQAMEVARFRKNNANSSGASTGYSDVGRTQTQQQLLLALAKKVLSWNSISRVNGFVNIFNEYVDTDLSLKDMAYFAAQAVNVDLASAQTTTLDGRGDAVYHGKRYCFELDQEKTLETVNRLINPYTRDLTLADMHLMKAERYMG